MGFAIAGAIIGVIGTAIGTYMQVQQINAQVDAANTEQKLREQEAQSERDVAAYEETQFRRRAGLLLGKQHAELVATGLDTSSGSPLLLELDSVKQTELEALNIRAIGARKAQASEFESQLARTRASYYGSQRGLAIGAGVASAASSILGGMYYSKKSTVQSTTRPISGAPSSVY